MILLNACFFIAQHPDLFGEFKILFLSFIQSHLHFAYLSILLLQNLEDLLIFSGLFLLLLHQTHVHQLLQIRLLFVQELLNLGHDGLLIVQF